MKKIRPILLVLVVSLVGFGMSKPMDELQTDKKIEKQKTAYTKPHADIDLHYQRPNVMQIGDRVDLDLTLKSKYHSDTLQLDVSHDAGLSLISEKHYEFTKKNIAGHKFTIQVSAISEGRFYVDINATINSNGKLQARSFSIPFVVGDISTGKDVKNNNQEKGYKYLPSQGVVSMPAVETSE